jgi:ADP-L-glycero-D-manno-heptose 6-epimerase
MEQSWDQRRVLVTGGAGLIGSALVWELNRRGCESVVITDFLGNTEKWRNLVPLRFENYLEADDFMKGLAESEEKYGHFDCVLHMGACSSTTETDATYLVRNNFETTRVLAQWAMAAGTRFLYASSAATYGDGAAGMMDGADTIEKLRPLNMYGYSKQMFDLHAKRHGWFDEITGLKFFNVFGPNEGHKGDMRSVVSKAFDQIQATGTLKLFKSYRPEFKDGEQVRDFLYVKDAVNMTLHLAQEPAATGLFNIGSGVARTWIHLGEAVFAALGRPSALEFIEMPESLRPKYQYHTLADLTRLRNAGYTADTTSLEAAVQDYVVNYLVPGRHLGDEPAP